MRMLAALLLLSGCTIDGLESSAISHLGKTPIIVPLASGTLDPLCWHIPMLFWRKPQCV